MRALVLKDFWQLEVVERPDLTPGSDQVVIQTIATGICGSDLHGFTGENGRRHPGQVMGHETVGRVASVGDGVTHLDVGRLVTVNPVVLPDADREGYAGREQHSPGKWVIGVRPDVDAAFADQFLAPARNVVPLPEDLPPLLGALIEPLAVAVHAVRRVGAVPGERVLVIGGGPIGQSIALVLALEGITDVVVSETDGGRRAVVSALGADTVDGAGADVAEAVGRALGGPADIAIDAVGTSGSIGDALAATRPGARICLVGMGSTELILDAFRLSTDERSLIGSYTYSDADFLRAAELVTLDPTRAETLISETVGPSDAHAAFVAASRGVIPSAKVLVVFDSPDQSPDTPGSHPIPSR